jgi:peptidoglycan/xylan/chitin deacetylase (PgdA/CDA1 family)
MSDTHPAPFAPPPSDPGDRSLAKTLAGKVSRLLARNIRSKSLPMRNTAPLVTFTFDDVPASACRNGAPILERHGARGTFYACGGGCGMNSPGGQLADVQQLRILHANGHEIGCHTYSHIALPTANADHITSDLKRNEWILKAAISGLAVRNFAYPYGALSLRTKRQIQVHFDSCRALLPGINTGRVDLGALKAWSLDNASIDRERISALLAETVRNNGWLIFCSHDVAEQPSRFGVTPDLLSFAIATAQAAGCVCTTTARSLSLIQGQQQQLERALSPQPERL